MGITYCVARLTVPAPSHDRVIRKLWTSHYRHLSDFVTSQTTVAIVTGSNYENSFIFAGVEFGVSTLSIMPRKQV